MDPCSSGKLKGVGRVWQITACRQQNFTSRAAMQRTLEAFLRFYNEQRPHQGGGL